MSRENILFWIIFLLALCQPGNCQRAQKSLDSKETICSVCENSYVTVTNVPEYAKKTVEAMYMTGDSRNFGCEWGLSAMRRCAKPNVLVPSLVVNKCYSLRRVTTAVGMKKLFPDAVFELIYHKRGCTSQWANRGDGCYNLEEIFRKRKGKLSKLALKLFKRWKDVKDSGELCIYTP